MNLTSRSSKPFSILNALTPLAKFQCLVAGTIIFGVATTLLKLSFLFFYYRIFPIRRYTIASVIIGVFVAIYFLLFELTQFLQCRPFQYNWDKTIPNGRCANIQLLALATSKQPLLKTLKQKRKREKYTASLSHLISGIDDYDSK